MKRTIIIITVLAIALTVGCSKQIDNSGLGTTEDERAEKPTVYFNSAMTSDGTQLYLDTDLLLSLDTDEKVFNDPELEGQQMEFEHEGKKYVCTYTFSWKSNLFSGCIDQYDCYEDGKPVASMQVSEDYPDFKCHIVDELLERETGEWTEESLEFALSAISQSYGEDVSKYELYYDASGHRSICVYKTVDGLTFLIGKCGVYEDEGVYKLSRILVTPKSLNDRFHLIYTTEEIKEMIEESLSDKYPGLRVDSISIGNIQGSNWYEYVVQKETFAYSFWADISVLNEDGEEVTAHIACFIPFELDE